MPGPLQVTAAASDLKLGWIGIGLLELLFDSWNMADSCLIIVLCIVSLVMELDSRLDIICVLAPLAPPPPAVTLKGLPSTFLPLYLTVT